MKSFVICWSLLYVGLVGCGSSGEDSNSDSGDASKRRCKVAILIPSSPTDGGWGQVGADGLKYVAKELGIERLLLKLQLLT